MSDIIYTIDDDEELSFEIAGPPTPRIFLAEDKGPKGDPGALTPSTLAARPAASSVPAGTVYYATDSDQPLAISTGSAWITPPSPSPYVTRAVDETDDLTTTIETLNTAYQVGGLETADVVWPGGVARVSVSRLAQKDAGHVATPADSVMIQRSTDSGATWSSLGPLIGWRQAVAGSAWIPEQPIVAESDTITAGATVRFRAAIIRIFAGTVPVTVPWANATRSVTVEALR